MLHKKLIYIVLIVSFIACRSKNPGMSKDEIVRTLDEQAMQHETAVRRLLLQCRKLRKIIHLLPE